MRPRKVVTRIGFFAVSFVLGWAASQALSPSERKDKAAIAASTTLNAENSAKIEPPQDERVSGVAKETSPQTPDQSQPTQPMRSQEQQLGLLKEISLVVLKKAYEDKLERVERNHIETRFKSNVQSEPAARDEEEEKTFRILKPLFERPSYWIARGRFEVGEKHLPVNLAFHYYHASDYSELDALSFAKPQDVCWSLEVVFPSIETKNNTGMSGCLFGLNQREGQFYAVQQVRVPELEAYYSHIAIPLPQPDSKSDQAEFLTTINPKWVSAGSVTWTTATKEEVEQIQKERKW
ncbi:MAG: hypothetical protein AB1540_17795 [Bdellovibrionota bacterium]